MKYDINVHLPQQVENFMNGFAQGDPALLERVLGNIKNIVPSDGFNKDLDDYQKKRKEKIDNLLKKAQDSVKTVVEMKKPDELFIDIEEIKNDLNASIGLIEGDYWDTIKVYLLEWVSRMDIEQKE